MRRHSTAGEHPPAPSLTAAPRVSSLTAQSAAPRSNQFHLFTATPRAPSATAPPEAPQPQDGTGAAATTPVAAAPVSVEPMARTGAAPPAATVAATSGRQASPAHGAEVYCHLRSSFTAAPRAPSGTAPPEAPPPACPPTPPGAIGWRRSCRSWTACPAHAPPAPESNDMRSTDSECFCSCNSTARPVKDRVSRTSSTWST